MQTDPGNRTPHTEPPVEQRDQVAVERGSGEGA